MEIESTNLDEKLFNDYERQKLVSLNLIKYKEYADYLSSDFFNTLLIEFASYYNLESGISKDVLLKIFIKMKVQQKLSKEIRNGDIELEIKLIDKYKKLTDSIITKLNIAPDKIDSEAILIKALEEYNTDKIFSLYILDKIKEELNKDKIKKFEVEEYFDFSKIVEEVTPLEGVIMLLKLGKVTGLNYSEEEITEYLKISKETVAERFNHGMTLYRKATTAKQKVLKTKGR